jgi:hypothetical protein
MHKLMNLEAAPRPVTRSFRPLPARSIPQASAISGRYFSKQLITGLPLVTADLLTLAVVAVLVSLVSGLVGASLMGILPFLAIALIVVNTIHGLYPAIGIHPAEELRLCSISTSVVGVTALALALATSTAAGLMIAGVVVWIGLLVGIPLSRGAARLLAGRFDFWTQPVLIIGGIQEGAKLFQEMQANRSCGLRPLGIIADPASQWRNEDLVGKDSASLCIGTLEEAASIAAIEGVYWVVVISSGGRDSDHDRDFERYLHNIPHRLYTFEDQHRNEYEDLFAESSSLHS